MKLVSLVRQLEVISICKGKFRITHQQQTENIYYSIYNSNKKKIKHLGISNIKLARPLSKTLLTTLKKA